jgi:MFS family permease
MLPTDSFKRNVPILAFCQALYMSGSSLLVATSALVGYALAEDKTYASLGFTVQLLSTMLASVPAAALMSRIGRKPAFLVGTVIALLGAMTCTYAILHGQFVVFILGSALLGTSAGFANYYRFAAADNVDEAHKSRAISYVLAGGVLAALIGPNLANLTRDVVSGAAFAGSYASITVLYVLSFILLSQLRLPQQYQQLGAERGSGRPLAVIARQPRFVIAVITGMLGYAVMTLVMTATPLAMQHHHHPFSDTSFVIQWHVLGMFAPSFFTGQLIQRFGLLRILMFGAAMGVACVAINLMGTSVSHFWVALVLLGLSWNFLFIGATTLLTTTYRPEERFKSQALNDFLVFSMVSTASLSAGALHHLLGWRVVNQAALPMLAVILLGLVWLYRVNRSNPETAVS